MNYSFFDGKQKFEIDKPIRLISLFSGYDSQKLAFDYLQISVEHWKTCEMGIEEGKHYDNNK